jgi:hypothetical protein
VVYLRWFFAFRRKSLMVLQGPSSNGQKNRLILFPGQVPGEWRISLPFQGGSLSPRFRLCQLVYFKFGATYREWFDFQSFRITDN